MFVINLAETLQPKARFNKVIGGAVTSFLLICGFYLFNNQVQVYPASKPTVVLKPFIEPQPESEPEPEQPKKLDRTDFCEQLVTHYQLQGVVLDHKNTVALVKEVESGAILLISKIETNSLKLETAELSKVKLLRNGCRFTLHLHQPSDREGHEISPHYTTAR